MTQYSAPNWPVNYAGVDVAIFQGGNGPDQALFEKMAAELLWNWTGRVLGTTTETIRPCRHPSSAFNAPSSFEGSGPWPFLPGFGSGRQFLGGTVGSWVPVLVAGAWYNLRCGTCSSTSCSCEPDQLVSLELPGSPQSVIGVKVDGVLLDPAKYWLNGMWLIRNDGTPWPFTQDLTLPDTQVGTWSVTYERGVPVPVGGQIAAAILATELAKAWTGADNCSLPSRLQTMTREGVTIGVADPFDGSAATITRDLSTVPQIKTGIWAIDSWVAGTLLPRYSVGVASPDYRRGR